MSFVTRGQVKHVTDKAMGAGTVVAAVIGGASGFFAADVIGLSNVINSLWDGSGMESIIPQLANVQPMIVALVSAGIYLGVGYAILQFGSTGIIGMVAKFAGWFAVGAGAREAFTGLTSGVKALKTVK
jgi:hypothetical protein